MGRFINADAFTSTGQGILGNNMFAYCANNPICYIDSSGYFFFTALCTVVGGAFGALDAVIQGKTGDEFIASVVGGAISGAISGMAADVLTFTGGTVAITVGVMATAGALGSVAESSYEYLTTKDKKISCSEGWEMARKAVLDALISALFAYIDGDIPSPSEKIAQKGFTKVVTKQYSKEISNLAANLFDEALATVTGGLIEFTITTYIQAIINTVERAHN